MWCEYNRASIFHNVTDTVPQEPSGTWVHTCCRLILYANNDIKYVCFLFTSSNHQLVCSWLMESSFHSWFCIFARVLLFYVWFQPCTPSTTCNKPACWKYLLIVEFLPILSYSKLSFWISLSTFNRYFDKLNNVCNVM